MQKLLSDLVASTLERDAAQARASDLEKQLLAAYVRTSATFVVTTGDGTRYVVHMMTSPYGMRHVEVERVVEVPDERPA